MRRRALALLLLAVVAGGGWLLRANGVLLGRDADGPLHVGHGSSGFIVDPDQMPQYEDVARVDGDPIEMESGRPALISPGLELLGPVAGKETEESPCIGCEGPWPPPGSSELRRLANDDRVVTALRAREPGIYYLHGIRYRYRRGLRRFDEVDDTDMCLFVGTGRRVPCPDGADLEEFEGLADIGGPADYGAVRFRDRGFDGYRAVYTYRPGGELSLELTVSNLSGEDRRVGSFTLGAAGGRFRDLLEPIPSEPVTIPAGGHRRVRIRARFDGCEHHPVGSANTWSAIEAGEDDVELSIPIEVNAPRHCPERR